MSGMNVAGAGAILAMQASMSSAASVVMLLTQQRSAPATPAQHAPTPTPAPRPTSTIDVLA